MINDISSQSGLYDAITGLPTLDSFLANANQIREHNDQDQYGILAVHMPCFSKAQQLYGAQQGDYLLSCVVHMFIRKCSFFITSCRYEKDTFLVLFDASGDEQEFLFPTLTKAFHSFSEYCNMLYPDFGITLQAGISLFRNTGSPIEEVIKQALFVMKLLQQEHSDELFRLYEDSAQSFRKMEQVILPIFENICENNHLIIYLQPRFHITTGNPIGAEALVRIMDSHGKLLKPNAFLPILDKYHLTCRLDLMVAERMLKIIRQWLMEGLSPLPISVNLSSETLSDDEFSLIFTQLVEKYPLELGYLDFSLKESFFHADLPMLEKLHQIHRLGFHIHLDDFELEAFTTQNISSMPVDGIELSHSFLTLAMKHARYEAILTDILSHMENQNMILLCKGIETAEEEAFVNKHEILYGQGYYYARPMPLDIFQKKYMSYSFSYMVASTL